MCGKVVSRYAKQGINKKKFWEHANTGKFWNDLRTPDKRLSLDISTAVC